MEGHGLDQYTVDDYIQKTNIVATLEKALNLAVEKQISCPEVFIADYLNTTVEGQGGRMILEKVMLHVNQSITYIVSYLSLMRSFNFPVDPELAKAISPEQVIAPTEVLRDLYGTDISQRLDVVYQKVQQAVQTKPEFVYQNLFGIYQVLTRSTKFHATMGLLGLGKQLYSLPQLIVNFLQNSIVKIGVLQTRQKEKSSVIASFRALGEIIAQFSASRTMISPLVQNDKTNELTADNIKIVQPQELSLRTFDQFLAFLDDEELNKDIRMQDDQQTSIKGTKPAKQEKAALPKFTIQQQSIIGVQNIQRVMKSYSGYVKLFLTVDLSTLSDNLLFYSEKSKHLYMLLLNLFMAVRDHIMVHFVNFAALRDEETVQQSGKEAKNATSKQTAQKGPPHESAQEEVFYHYTKKQAIEDIKLASLHYNQLTGFVGSPRLDTAADSELDQLTGVVKDQLINSPDLAAYYSNLVPYATQTEVKKDILAFQKKGCAIDAKQPKGKKPAVAKGKEEPDAVGKSPHINIGECCLIENYQYLQIDDREDILEYIDSVWGLVEESRAVIGLYE